MCIKSESIFDTISFLLKELAERYFNNTCTKEEARKVLWWFQTEEGEAFLQKKINEDIKKISRRDTSSSRIQLGENVRLRTDKSEIYKRNRHPRQLFIKAAAGFLVLVMCIGLYWVIKNKQATPDKTIAQKEYVTGPRQQEKITLADGTLIHLNQNSRLWLNADSSGQYRAVKLKGEAFFKVTHNPKRPFVVFTSNARIEDIGTAFDVKARSDGKNVQVAVIGGEVLFKSKKAPQQHAPKEQAVRLTKGHFGFLDVKQNRIKVNHFAVKNYLSWMNHRIVFVDAPLPKVGHQLEHLYHIKSVFASNDLKSRRITADFKADSLDKVLSVIAQTLHIDFRKNENKIVWLDK